MIDKAYNPDKQPDEVDESQLMDFTDHDKLRESILSSVKGAFASKFPIEDEKVSLRISNLRYNEKRRPEGIAKFKHALLSGGTLGVPLHGDVRLVDKATGDVLDEKKNHLLANVPYLTNRGSFVMRGTEYVTFNQSLLRPGIFARIKDNGEIESHIATKSGTGPSMRMYMEPDTGIYRLSLGTSRAKLYPILRSLGKTDADLENAWGKEVLDLNRKASDTRSFGRFYDKLIGSRGPAMIARLTNAEPTPHFDDDTQDELDEQAHQGSDDHQKEARAAHATIGEAREAVNRDPSPAQIEAANYSKGHIRIHGLEISIENPRGSARSGIDKNGKPWRSLMKGVDYGYFKGTTGADKDHVDVFLGPDHESELVFVVNQINPAGAFDEHKVLLGFTNKADAKQGYLDQYTPGWKGLGSIVPTTLAGFKEWLRTGNTTKSYPVPATKMASFDMTPGLSGVGGIGAMKGSSSAGPISPVAPVAPIAPIASPTTVAPSSAASMLNDLRQKRQAGVPSLKTAGGTKDPEKEGLATLTDPQHTQAGSPLGHITTRRKAGLPSFKVASVDDISDEQKDELIHRQLSKMEVDPEVSHRTLGKAHYNVDPETLIDTSAKLLAVARGDAEPDDRDALSNKWFRTPDDMFADRVTKDAGRVAQALFWRSRYDRSLSKLKPGHFTPQLHGLVVGNSLSQVVSGINPMEFMDLRLKVVQTGEGGISSTDMIPDSAREVHPSQMGFIDYIKTPESTGVGVDQRFAWSARKGPGNQIYTKVMGRDGKPVWRTPSQLYGKTLAFPESSVDPVSYH